MKSKILYICLGISLLINIILSVCVVNLRNTNGNKIDRTRSMVPDEKTAERIAEAYLDTLEGILGWEENVEYEAEITFDEENYEWIVHYRPKVPEGYMVLDGAKIVGVRKDNGMLTFYAWK